jgi:hypothetical protein
LKTRQISIQEISISSILHFKITPSVKIDLMYIQPLWSGKDISVAEANHAAQNRPGLV